MKSESSKELADASAPNTVRRFKNPKLRKGRAAIDRNEFEAPVFHAPDLTTLEQDAIATAVKVGEDALNSDQISEGLFSREDKARWQSRRQFRLAIADLIRHLPKTNKLFDVDVTELAAAWEAMVWQDAYDELIDMPTYMQDVDETLGTLEDWKVYWETEIGDEDGRETGCVEFCQYIDHHFASELKPLKLWQEEQEEQERETVRKSFEEVLAILGEKFAKDDSQAQVDVTRTAAEWEHRVWTRTYMLTQDLNIYFQTADNQWLGLKLYMDLCGEPEEGQTAKKQLSQYFKQDREFVHFIEEPTQDDNIDDELYNLAGGNDSWPSSEDEDDNTDVRSNGLLNTHLRKNNDNLITPTSPPLSQQGSYDSPSCIEQGMEIDEDNAPPFNSGAALPVSIQLSQSYEGVGILHVPIPKAGVSLGLTLHGASEPSSAPGCSLIEGIYSENQVQPSVSLSTPDAPLGPEEVEEMNIDHNSPKVDRTMLQTSHSVNELSHFEKHVDEEFGKTKARFARYKAGLQFSKAGLSHDKQPALGNITGSNKIHSRTTSAATYPIIGVELPSFIANTPRPQLFGSIVRAATDQPAQQSLPDVTKEVKFPPSYDMDDFMGEAPVAQSNLPSNSRSADATKIASPNADVEQSAESNVDVSMSMSMSPENTLLSKPTASIFNTAGLILEKPSIMNLTVRRSQDKVDFGFNTADLSFLKQSRNVPAMHSTNSIATRGAVEESQPELKNANFTSSAHSVGVEAHQSTLEETSSPSGALQIEIQPDPVVSISAPTSDGIAVNSFGSAKSDPQPKGLLSEQMDMIMKHISKLHQDLFARMNNFDTKLESIQASLSQDQHVNIASGLVDMRQTIADMGTILGQDVVGMLAKSSETAVDNAEQQPLRGAVVEVCQETTLAKVKDTVQDEAVVAKEPPEAQPEERNAFKKLEESSTNIWKPKKKESPTVEEPTTVDKVLSEINKFSSNIEALQKEWNTVNKDGNIPQIFLDSAAALHDAYQKIDKKSDFKSRKQLELLIKRWKVLHNAALTFWHLSNSCSSKVQSTLDMIAKHVQRNSGWKQGCMDAATRNRRAGNMAFSKRWEALATNRAQANAMLLDFAKSKLAVMVEHHRNYYDALQRLQMYAPNKHLSMQISDMASKTLVDYQNRIAETFAAFNLPLEELSSTASFEWPPVHLFSIGQPCILSFLRL
ncbi:hypothetical protein BKA66DRAFT_441593 [Pyrenochaeta sp. MPI-SDFR-AT-0127]|nr:hypothetical protein BKA66DRAFT_441593 [Pyrenochaeta sp. MPI-SDFR-AT-0127]